MLPMRRSLVGQEGQRVTLCQALLSAPLPPPCMMWEAGSFSFHSLVNMGVLGMRGFRVKKVVTSVRPMTAPQKLTSPGV